MAGKLKPLDVAREVTPGKYADGGGLYLVVAGPTSRNWSYRYWFKGKERWHGLGSLQDISLKEARIKRDAARQEVRAGVDIVDAKRSARLEAKAIVAADAKPFSNAPKDTSRKIGRAGAGSTAHNGPRRSSGMPTRLSAPSRSRKLNQATFSICSGQSGLRSARRQTGSAAESKP